MTLLEMKKKVLRLIEEINGQDTLTDDPDIKEKLNEAYTSLKEAYQGTIESLRIAVDAKDSYTAGHSDRVAYYSKLIGQKLGLSPEDLQAKLEANKKDLYEIIVNAIGNEYGNKQSAYEMEGLEELKKNIKLTKNVKLDDDIYMAFLEPLKNKISDTIIKKYDSKVGINFVFDISNMLHTGLEKVKDRKVTSGGKVYTLKYDMSWSVHGILVASATLYDYKNSEVTKMILTNLDTEEGAKNLAQYATGLSILNKEVEENATYEVMKEVFKEITNDRKTASKLAKTLKFGQEITNAMLTDEAAKKFAATRGGALQELVNSKGQGWLINSARNCVRGMIAKYIPNGQNIVKAVDQVDKINKTITKYSDMYKNYNSYNSKTSTDELKKMELEFNSYSEALSKILSAIR